MTCLKCHRRMTSTELLYCSECELELKSLDRKAKDIRRLEMAIDNVKNKNNNPGILRVLNFMLNRKKMSMEENYF